MARMLTLITLSALVIAAAGYGWWSFAADKPSQATLSPSTHSSTQATQKHLPPTGPEVVDEGSTFITTLAREIKLEFGLRIDEVAVQARLYLIRKEVLKRFPAQGAFYFEQALVLAFPDRADAILSLIDTLHEYNEWLSTEHLALSKLTPLERQGKLWQKRRELFGDDADLIWADERSRLANKQQAVQQILSRLDEDTTIGLDEKLYQLKTELSATFDAEQAYILENGGMITEVFFSLNSVQQDLAEMSSQERQASIDRVRRQMGYSEEQIERLRERDAQKNQRWERGNRYMAERQQLVSRLEGKEQQKALEALRQEYFGHEAKTIRLEEENGFFRFKRPRYFGRN